MKLTMEEASSQQVDKSSCSNPTTYVAFKTFKFIGVCGLISLVLLSLVASPGAAYPSGAPDQACKDLRPGHGVEPTSGPAPFELTADRAGAAAGEQIKVSLTSSSGTTFKGLLVQALNDKEEPIGKFLAGKGLKLIDSCSAVTHSDKEPKKMATLAWEAPAAAKADDKVTFRATVVHKMDQFYMDIKSKVSET